jgi:two-component system sensor histidine kinase KdpD
VSRSVNPKVLVAVGSQGEARELIRAGERLASALDASWEAIFVETSSGHRTLEFEANEALGFAAQQGASVVRLNADTVVAGICAHLDAEPARLVVMGHRAHSPWSRLHRQSLVEALRARRPELAIHLVPSTDPVPPSAKWLSEGGTTASLLKACAAVIATTALALGLNWAFGMRSLSLLFLFPVIAAAARWGLAASVAAALLGTLAFNFFFLAPFSAFRLSAPQTWFMGGVLLAVAVYTSLMTAALRARLALSARSARENAAVAGFAQKLTRVADWQSTAAAVCDQVANIFGLNVVLLREVEGRLKIEAGSPADVALSPVDWAAVDWAWSQGEPAGAGTNALSAINWQFQPLRTSLGVLAIVGVARDDGRDPIASEQKLMFDTLLAQAALAHERLRLEDAMRENGTASLGQDVRLLGGNDAATASLAQ